MKANSPREAGHKTVQMRNLRKCWQVQCIWRLRAILDAHGENAATKLKHVLGVARPLTPVNNSCFLGDERTES
jgi:hypothetical protein